MVMDVVWNITEYIGESVVSISYFASISFPNVFYFQVCGSAGEGGQVREAPGPAWRLSGASKNVSKSGLTAEPE